MSSVQLINLLLPLLTFPFLIKNLGLEGFGLINYALAVVHFFVVFVDFGYTLVGTRDIALAGNNTFKLSKQFSIKWFSQLFLLIVAALIFGLLVELIPLLNEHSVLMWLSFGIVPANILLPTWFFQGTQKFSVLALLNLINRGLYTFGIFIFIKGPEDLLLVPLLNAGFTLFISIVGFLYLIRVSKLSLAWPGLPSIILSIKTSAGVSISGFAVTAYTYSAILILGFVSDQKAVGIFSAVEKVLLVFRIGLSTLFSVIYPRVCALAGIEDGKARAFLRRVFIPLIPLIVLGSILLWFLSSQIVLLLIGNVNPEILQLMQLLVAIPIIISLNIPSYQQLLAHNRQSYYSTVLLLGAIFAIILNLLLAPQFGATGTGLSVLFAESFITLGLIYASEFKFRELRIWLPIHNNGK